MLTECVALRFAGVYVLSIDRGDKFRGSKLTTGYKEMSSVINNAIAYVML